MAGHVVRVGAWDESVGAHLAAIPAAIAASPLAYVAAHATPILLIHDQDGRVAVVRQSQRPAVLYQRRHSHP